jgi:hypothetical protein
VDRCGGTHVPTKHTMIIHKSLLHIEKIATTACDESTLLSQNSREKVQFFNFVLNPPRIHRFIDGTKILSILRQS